MRLKYLPFVLLPFFVACATLAPKTVFLVRHGEKASHERDAELSVAGKLRAAHLAQILEKVELGRVFSTDFKRTRDTVAPTAQSHKLAIEIYDDSTQLASQIKKAKGNVLVAGHSNTVPEIVELLSNEKQNDIEDTDFGNLFIIPLSEACRSIIRLRY